MVQTLGDDMLKNPLFLILSVLLAVASVFPSAAAFATPAAPDNLILTVNSSLVDVPDSAPGNGVCETAPGSGVCTLRAAIMEANALPGADAILLPAGTYTLTRIGFEDSALDGDLDITADLTITGANAGTTIIDGNRALTGGRVLHVHTGVTAYISNLCIEDGLSRDDLAEFEGGGILNNGTLTLSAVCVRDNHALSTTGGIYNAGSLTVIDSVFSNNTSLFDSGAIYNTVVANLTVINTTFDNNHGETFGGAIVSRGALSVKRSRFLNNSAREGGAVYIDQDGVALIEDSTFYANTAVENGGAMMIEAAGLTMINSTLSGNFAGHHGGGLLVFSPTSAADLLNVTIANNTAENDLDEAGDGGGIYISSGVVRIANSIIANNVLRRPITNSLDDCFGNLVSQGYNLIRVTADCNLTGVTTGNKTGMNPLLGALSNNGGPTLTLAPQTGSPAIDAGNPTGCDNRLGAALLFDQRGFIRHANGGVGLLCDMGAVEYQSIQPYSLHLPLILR